MWASNTYAHTTKIGLVITARNKAGLVITVRNWQHTTAAECTPRPVIRHTVMRCCIHMRVRRPRCCLFAGPTSSVRRVIGRPTFALQEFDNLCEVPHSSIVGLAAADRCMQKLQPKKDGSKAKRTGWRASPYGPAAGKLTVASRWPAWYPRRCRSKPLEQWLSDDAGAAGKNCTNFQPAPCRVESKNQNNKGAAAEPPKRALRNPRTPLT